MSLARLHLLMICPGLAARGGCKPNHRPGERCALHTSNPTLKQQHCPCMDETFSPPSPNNLDRKQHVIRRTNKELLGELFNMLGTAAPVLSRRAGCPASTPALDEARGARATAALLVPPSISCAITVPPAMQPTSDPTAASRHRLAQLHTSAEDVHRSSLLARVDGGLLAYFMAARNNGGDVDLRLTPVLPCAGACGGPAPDTDVHGRHHFHATGSEGAVCRAFKLRYAGREMTGYSYPVALSSDCNVVFYYSQSADAPPPRKPE